MAVVLPMVLAGATPVGPSALAAEPVVRAVLFFSPSCGHCHLVLTESLPPIQAKFGAGLQVAIVDVTMPQGMALYEAAVTSFAIPEDRVGVPTLIVGDTVLVGSGEIPAQLPSLVERWLADGGLDWPPIPGLAEILPTPQAGATPQAGEPDRAAPGPEASTGVVAPPVVAAVERAGCDPAGSALAIVVLGGLLASLGWVAAVAWRAGGRARPGLPSRWIAAAAVAGIVVAGYLASVEVAGTSAVCGPVGDCNAVHASAYARPAGIPVGLLGVAGYAAIISCWFVARRTPVHGRAARYGIVGLAAAGTLFSAYLTLLEPFVIGATCAWCLASAVIMNAILLLAAASMWPSRPPDRAGRSI
jgi:uncharacterized membrane protein